MPSEIASCPETESTSTFGRKFGETRSGPRSRSVSACSRIPGTPPIAEPKMIPTRDGSNPFRPASSRASRPAATPSRTFRSSFRASFGETTCVGSNPFTSAATRTGRPSVSKAEIQSIPLSPACAARHVEGMSSPSGVTAPMPVTATRFMAESLVFESVPAPDVPFPPMEAELVRELPAGDGWQYEPKWDGFRGVLENVGKELALWSRNERPLLRYFGELLPPRSALDGEIVIVRDGAVDFDSMQMRLHPAESRIRRLSAEIPAQFVAFDVLLWEGEPVWKRPLEERRAELERVAKGFRLSPCTREVADARAWLAQFEALGLDGVVAKRLGQPYLPGSRDGMVKVKEHKTADCVVVGVRWKGEREAIATLLLGLYREDGDLDYVGSCAVAASRRAEVAERVLPLLEDDPDWQVSEPNRWGTGELEQSRVRPELV